MLAARREYPVTSRSQSLPRFLPARTPRVMPSSPDSSQEEARSQREMESFSQMTSATGLRNLLIPAMTLQFASISEIIGGSVLVEQVFSYRGLGQAAVTAVLGRDVRLLLGITVVTAVLAASGNLAASILYGIVDPRIRKGAAR